MGASTGLHGAGLVARFGRPALLSVLGLCLCLGAYGQPLPAETEPPAGGAPAALPLPGPAETVQPPGLPALGKWMVDPDGTPAHWLGEIHDGKGLREPINVVIVDAAARTPEEAKARLVQAAAAAGYPSRAGHSGGYRGWIGGILHRQLPEEKDHAFSNAPFAFDNNHGRIFGPFRFQDAYVFTGALSRERVDVLADPMHQYASFNVARDDFARSMDRATAYKLRGFVDLQNALVADPRVATGDHDGVAALLKAEP